MRFYIIFIFAVLINNQVCSQSMTMLHIDSLQHELLMATTDTSRVLIMANLTEGYRGSKPDSAIFYAQQALQLAKKIQFPRGEVLALVGMSVVMRELGNLPKALGIALKAQKIAEAHGYAREEAFSLVRIANVYVALLNHTEALNYLRKASEKLRPYPDHVLNGAAHMIAGNSLEQMNKLDSALYEEDLALQFAKKHNSPVLIVNIQNVYANIYLKKGNPKLALQYYHQSIGGAIKLKDARTISAIFRDVAAFYKKINQEDSAIYYAKQALEYAQVLSYKNQEMRAAILLSEIYEKSDPKAALYYYKVAASAKDSLYSAGKVQAVQTLEFEEKERLKELETEKLAYRNKITQNVLLFGAGIFLISALVLFRNNKQKQKANAILGSTLSHLKTTQSQLIQSEKMASLGELTAGIAHEIQNPLNFVNNFSEVNTELIEELQQELKAGKVDGAISISNNIRDNEEKINHHGKRADAIVKGMLQHSQSSNGVKEPTDINTLAGEYLRLAYHGMRAKDKSFNVTMKTDFDESIGNINIVPQDIGRVILNLITNAFYAVAEKKKRAADGYEPTVSIRTKKSADKVLISVKDNGNGISSEVLDKIFQPFFTTKPTGQGTGLGLSLSYDIVKAHGGELKVETKEGDGAEFIISLSQKI